MPSPRRFAWLRPSLVGAALLLFALIATGTLALEREQVDGETISYGVGVWRFRDKSPDVRDGPHVWPQGDTLAVVASVCGDSVQTAVVRPVGRVFHVSDPCAPGRRLSVPTDPPTPPPAEFDGVERIFALSDIEGESAALDSLLVAGGVTDREGRWTFGRGHLVLVGDLVDRGERVTDVLWTVYRLEQEAGRAGGRVHYVLGNHETLLMLGDHDDAAPKYRYAAHYIRQPLAALVGPQTVLGAWLRTRPAAVRIDSFLFVHGGIEASFARRSGGVARTNTVVRAGLARPERLLTDPEVKAAFGEDGPLWNRSLVRDADLRADDVRRALAPFGASVAVVGHTPVEHVSALAEGSVIAIDAPHAREGHSEGLLLEGGRRTRVGLRDRSVLR